MRLAAVHAVAGDFGRRGQAEQGHREDAAQAAQIRANTMDEIIRATSGAFLGMTIGCARCHDHKFDPLRQKDYYRLQAFLAATHDDDVPLVKPLSR